MLDYVEKIVYANEDFSIIGSVPLGEENQRIEFKIQGMVSKEDRRNKHIPYGTGIKPARLPEYNLSLEDLSLDSKAMMRQREIELHRRDRLVKGMVKH